MPVQIKNTREVAANNGIKFLVYGRAGAGKTMLCNTAPNPIILSAEAGLLSLRRFDLPYIEINTIQDLYDAYLWATQASEAKQFQTICLDSISEIAESILANARQVGPGAKDPRAAYGELQERTTDLVKRFRDLPGFHVYFSAKQEAMRTDISGVTINGPAMPGAKLGPQLPYLFDEVFNLNIESQGNESWRYLLTKSNALYEAKDRSGMLDPIERPDLSHIIGKITGEIASEPEETQTGMHVVENEEDTETETEEAA